jgi:hypothetical protein
VKTNKTLMTTSNLGIAGIDGKGARLLGSDVGTKDEKPEIGTRGGIIVNDVLGVTKRILDKRRLNLLNRLILEHAELMVAVRDDKVGEMRNLNGRDHVLDTVNKSWQAFGDNHPGAINTSPFDVLNTEWILSEIIDIMTLNKRVTHTK